MHLISLFHLLFYKLRYVFRADILIKKGRPIHQHVWYVLAVYFISVYFSKTKMR